MSTASTKRTYRMGARAEAVAARTERILAAAWHHFAERRYDDVRLADIAREAQVTVQTLHTRFGAKDDLFAAAFRWFGDRVGARRDAVAPGDVVGAIRELYDGYERDGRAVLRLMGEEERIPAVRSMIDRGRRFHRGWVERTLGPLVDGLPEADRGRRLTELTVATDLLVWKLLRLDMGLDRGAAEQTVVDMVTRLKEGG